MPTTSHLVGHVEAIYRYPVKSMAGEPLETASLGPHGLEGDRRFALRRLEGNGYPWLTASKLAELVRFVAVHRDGAGLPSHVRTPEGTELPILGEELTTDIARRHGAPVQMARMDEGIFDETPLSVITTATVDEIGGLSGRKADVRRFRPNVLVRPLAPGGFQENAWVGAMLAFGEGHDRSAVAVTMRDVRCSMIGIDPDSAESAPEVLKAVARANQNCAGVYATVARTGRLAVGQPVVLLR